MKKTYYIIGVLAVLATLMVARAQQVIAVVDMEELVRRHPNTADDKKQLEATLKQYEDERDKTRDQVEKLRAEFEAAAREADSPALSAAGRKKAEEQALKKREIFADAERLFAETLQLRRKQLSDQEMRMLKRTSSDLRDVITKVAKKKKIDLVLGASTVAYNDPAMDITEEVLRELGVDPKALLPDDK